MKSIKAVLFSLFFSFNILSAHADIKVGTVFLYPPFVMSLSEGFDIDFINLLCQKMNTTCTLVPMDFNKLFPALDDGEIDIAIGGIVISPVREKNYIFSLPYMLSKGQFLILQSSNISSLNDLAGKTVGVLRGGQDGSVYYAYLNANYPGLFQTLAFNDIEDVITALSTNTIAAAFIHESTAQYWEENGGGQFKTFEKASLVGDGMAIMAMPQNKALIQQINQQIQAADQDGTFVRLYNTYFGNL
ncbi:transporter substrate-binding domain-containing protein [Legionella brunensis]|uniref:Arginine-binding periplasmic protein n=1 Tax=Legionella brunensis TaxID=29422 RepID=A0A0W0SUC5_9GAMM|nr:transporter substrate-binding domain-containing protein [Legionella brunensis]KTC86968.1 arginine-binding periplasmic protein [Legionella brunensis]